MEAIGPITTVAKLRRTDNPPMLYLILNYLRDLQRPQRDLLFEILALRQQILVLERLVKRPRFKDRERGI